MTFKAQLFRFLGAVCVWAALVLSAERLLTENGTLPESEYLALYDFYNATDGADWMVFRGAPWQFSTKVNPCTQDWQGVSCALNNATSIYNVIELSLPDRRLTGTLPASIANLTQLQFLNVTNNELSGTLPSFASNGSLLQFLHLAKNKFSGSIPPSFGELTQLRSLTLSSPTLTGTLPAFLVSLPELIFLEIYDTALSGHLPDFPADSPMEFLFLIANHLSGTVPESIGYLPHLQLVELIDTNLHGTIPASLGSVVSLFSVTLIDNLLSGTVPASICSANISTLALASNMLTGPLPAALRNMTGLVILDLSVNKLSGSILKAGFSNLHLLRELQLQANQLTGPLTGTFNTSTQTSLVTIQLDYNQFTGTLPSELFSLPSITTLSIVGACLRGTFPDNVCQATTMEALILYGLTSGASCRAQQEDWLALHPRGSFHGAFPTCLLRLPRMKTLLMSSNALTGKLSDWEIGESLLELDLCHNLLSGTISPSVQNHTWLLLDLSHNKLSGDLQPDLFAQINRTRLQGRLPLAVSDVEALGLDRPRSGDLEPTLKLSTNRLSGKLPASIMPMQHLSLLAGNLFSCNYAQTNLPRHDEDVGTYECASNSFDISAYVWLGVLVAVIACFAYLRRGTHWLDIVSPSIALEQRGNPNTQRFVLSPHCDVVKLCWRCAAVAITVLMLYYAVISQYRGTHMHQYAYVLSAIYTSGAIAFSLDVVLWTSLLVFACFVLTTRGADSNIELPGSVLEPPKDIGSGTIIINSTAILRISFALINMVVVMGANVAFVYVVLYGSARGRTAAQVALSIFKTGWNNVASPFLLKQLRSRLLTEEQNENFFTLQLFVALFNNIAIPCLVVAAIDPNCVSNILVAQGTDSGKYLVPYCRQAAVGGSCDGVSYSAYAIEFVPPYTYSYQCSASFVTSYAPAFIYMSLSAVLLDPLFQFTLLQAFERSRPGSITHSLVSWGMPPLLKPPTIPVSTTNGSHLVGATSLLVTLFTHLCILLTFGVVFPPVALAMAVSAAAVVYITRHKLQRFMATVAEAHQLELLNAIAEECACVGTREEVSQAMKTVVCYCCSFYTLFLFDTLGDGQGFAAAVWVLFVVPLAPFGVFILVKVVREARGVAGATNTDVELTELKRRSQKSVAAQATANPILFTTESV